MSQQRPLSIYLCVILACCFRQAVTEWRFCAYDDKNDESHVTRQTECLHHYGNNFVWETEEITNHGDTEVSITFSTTYSNDSLTKFLPYGKISVRFSVYATDTHPLGSYYYSVQGGLSVAVTITIDRLETSTSRTRVAPMLFVFANETMNEDEDFIQETGYSIDASSGPNGRLESTFLLLNKRTTSRAILGEEPITPGYLHLAPVSIVNPNHIPPTFTVANAGFRRVVKLVGSSHKFTRSLPLAYYGDNFSPIHAGSHVGHVAVREQYIDIGKPGDGFYRATNYSSWTCVLGFGVPAMEQSSNSASYWRLPVVLLCLTAVITPGIMYWRYRRCRHGLNNCCGNNNEHPTSTTPLLGVHRIESGAQQSISTQANQSTIMTMDSGPVEPFQMRKAMASAWNRMSQPSAATRMVGFDNDDHERRDPLYQHYPPPYEATTQRSVNGD